MDSVKSERELAALAIALGARTVSGWSPAEEQLARNAAPIHPTTIAAARKHLRRGADPLGDAFCAIRSPDVRRSKGATYTPPAIVNAMLKWSVAACPKPSRIVDPGVGSARFLVKAGALFPGAKLIGIDVDPLAALIARANIAAAGLAASTQIVVADYRAAILPKLTTPTLFVGNPPYVRHHLIADQWKAWLTKEGQRHGHEVSQLAGLHLHFFLATLNHASAGDHGAFVTAAEWLDVNYGQFLRQMLLNGLGGKSITVVEPTAIAFADAATTAAITCFEIGSRGRSIRLKRVASLADLVPLDGGRPVRRERLEAARRWSPLTRPVRKAPEGFVELGELCRVHRGQVTGSNEVWIAGTHSAGLPNSVLFPTVTKARELFDAGEALKTADRLRRVIDLPAELDMFAAEERRRVEQFLKVARRMGAFDSYTAQHRKAWWTVGLREPAPVLCTYMARRPPAFVRNLAAARHINIAHGLYPREAMSEDVLSALVRHLSSTTSTQDGRTYAGGLTKFEPREIERLLVPGPDHLISQGTA